MEMIRTGSLMDKQYHIDSAAAASLAARLSQERTQLCRRVSARLLVAFPELKQMLQLEGSIAPEIRLSEVSTERFCELLRGALIFETYSLLDQEFGWAVGVLPRYGVTYQHQSSMAHWFFAELYHLGMDTTELNLARDMEAYTLELIRRVYQDPA